MTKRREFIKKSALNSAAIAMGGIGFGSEMYNSVKESRISVEARRNGSVSLQEVKNKIGEAMEAVTVVDPHCHLDAGHPAARNIADIVLYHHVWIELVSAGMGQYEVTRAGLPHELVDPEMEPLERVRRALPYLPRIRNTTVGSLFRWLLEDLYGIKDGLQVSNLDKLAAEVKRASELIRQCQKKLRSTEEEINSVFRDLA